MASGQQAAGGFRRDCRGDGRGVGQVGWNATAHLAGKLEIKLADLFLRVSKEMRRRQKNPLRARALRPSRHTHRVVQPDGTGARVERRTAAVRSEEGGAWKG